MERPAPALHAARPGIPPLLGAAYQKMMAKRPEDRPASMADVVDLLHPCKAEALEKPRSTPELKVFNEAALARAGAAKTKPAPSRSQQFEPSLDPVFGPDLNLENLAIGVPSEIVALNAFARTTTRLPRRINRPGIVLIAAGAAAVLGAGILGVVAFRGSHSEGTRPTVIAESKVAGVQDRANATETPPSAPEKWEAVADAKKDTGGTHADSNTIATVAVNAPPAPEPRTAIVKKDRDRISADADSTKTDRSHRPQNSRDAPLELSKGNSIDAKRPASKERHLVASRFDRGQNDGWITQNDDDSTNATRFIRVESEGPSYALFAENVVNGKDFGWLAPEKYCGDQAHQFGGLLKYRIWTDGNEKGMSSATWYIRLRGRAKVIFIDQATVGRPNPRHWKSYRIRLDSSGGWKLSTPSGSITPASDDDIREVLSELKDLWILGEFGEGRNHCRLNYVEFGAD
jgi:Laminin B (Domain IV)